MSKIAAKMYWAVTASTLLSQHSFANPIYIKSVLPLKSEIARMTVFFTIDYSLCTTFLTGLFVINSRI